MVCMWVVRREGGRRRVSGPLWSGLAMELDIGATAFTLNTFGCLIIGRRVSICAYMHMGWRRWRIRAIRMWVGEIDDFMAVRTTRVAAVTGEARLNTLITGLLGCCCPRGSSGTLATVTWGCCCWRFFGSMTLVNVSGEQVAIVLARTKTRTTIDRKFPKNVSKSHRKYPGCGSPPSELVTTVLAFVGSVSGVWKGQWEVSFFKIG